MTTWADIQRLAADLQRVQLGDGTKRLSDANCVEIVSMLMSMGLVNLVVTTDGKEYVTRKHLVTECSNECLAADGRISLTDLAAQLNVDLDHVQTAVNQLLNQNQYANDDGSASEFFVCAGELLHRDFINEMCSHLNSRLQDLGHISMIQLTKNWDLSTEVLNQHILPEIGEHPGARISAIRFDDQLCTPQYINGLRAKFIAILIALTKPTTLDSIQSHIGISLTLFFKLLSDLSNEDRLPGKILGNKNSLKSLYLPYIHENMAKHYVNQKINTDHFIETIVLKRLSIPSDPTAFFKELLSQDKFDDLIFWPSVILYESRLWKECDSLAKNLLHSNHFCMLEDILPSQFTFLTDEDYAKVVGRLQKYGNGANLRSTEDNSVVFEHPQLIERWLKLMEPFVRERAEKDSSALKKAQLNATIAIKKEGQKALRAEQKDDWKMEKAGKKGKGTGKKSASAAKGKRKEEPDMPNRNDPSLSIPPLSTNELFTELKRCIDVGFELPDILCVEIEEEFSAKANKLYRTLIVEKWQTTESGEQQDQKRLYEQKMDRISHSYTDIFIFEKGTEAFEEHLAADLRNFLLRTLCSELAQSLLHVLADPSAEKPPQNFSAKLREQLIASLESKVMQKLAKELFDAMDTMEHFHEAIQRFANQAGLMLRQPDKKERSDRISSLGVELRSLLSTCSEPPSVLLLAVLIYLQTFHGLAVHASGRFVSPLIEFISSKPGSADKQKHEQLSSLFADTQRLVVASIKRRRMDEGTSETDELKLQEGLSERIQQIKTLFPAKN